MSELAEARVKDEIGRKVHDADCEGHSLAMLGRIAAALGKRVEIRFVPLRRAG